MLLINIIATLLNTKIILHYIWPKIHRYICDIINKFNYSLNFHLENFKNIN